MASNIYFIFCIIICLPLFIISFILEGIIYAIPDAIKISIENWRDYKTKDEEEKKIQQWLKKEN